MWIAELKDKPGHYAVSPDDGDTALSTTSTQLACMWITSDQCEAWSRHHGDLWSPVKKPQA